MTRLSELFNVNHFIVSQVNPHVYPFMQKSLKSSWFQRVFHKVVFLFKSEFLYRINQMMEFGASFRLLYLMKSVLSQKYEGDITIVPEMEIADFLSLLVSPSHGRFKDLLLRGSRSTWPSKFHLHEVTSLYFFSIRAFDCQESLSFGDNY